MYIDKQLTLKYRHQWRWCLSKMFRTLHLRLISLSASPAPLVDFSVSVCHMDWTLRSVLAPLVPVNRLVITVLVVSVIESLVSIHYPQWRCITSTWWLRIFRTAASHLLVGVLTTLRGVLDDYTVSVNVRSCGLSYTSGQNYDNLCKGFNLFLALFMVAYITGQAIIFLACGFLLLLSSCFPHLISAVADWMSTILPHMVWP